MNLEDNFHLIFNNRLEAGPNQINYKRPASAQGALSANYGAK
jgi:hypothetical protein